MQNPVAASTSAKAEANPRRSTLTLPDGETLAVQDWPLPQGASCRGVVLIVHGLGEHAGRYAPVAHRLSTWGFAVRAYDHYGHGHSSGPRGGLPTPHRLLDDLVAVLNATHALYGSQTPLILLGHSMGGLVAGRLVALGRVVQGLVMSSPALGTHLSLVQKLLLAVVPRVAPNLRVRNGLDVRRISHNPDTVSAYRADPLVHDRVGARLGRFIADVGPATVACASQWRTPTLLLYAGQDYLVNPAGSRSFAANAPPALVQSLCFDALYHELFNELEAEPVFTELQTWLNARF